MEIDWLHELKTGIRTFVDTARALVVENALPRVAHCASGMNREIDTIAHGFGVRHARELERRHVGLGRPAGGSVALDLPWPLPAADAKGA
jgi:hypothetical protein